MTNPLETADSHGLPAALMLGMGVDELPAELYERLLTWVLEMRLTAAALDGATRGEYVLSPPADGQTGFRFQAATERQQRIIRRVVRAARRAAEEE